jgi:hypothetical protein
MQKECQLHDSKDPKTENKIQSLAKSNAYDSFNKDCVAQIKKVNNIIPCVHVSGDASFQLLRRSFS